MRKTTVLTMMIATALTMPSAFAQGRGGGGPPTGATGGPAGSMPTQSMDRISDHASFGTDTADRAAMQKDASVETRTQFGAEQSAAAKAKQDDTSTDARAKTRQKTKAKAEVTANDASETTTNDAADQAAFGQDTAARAKAQKDADVDTRTQFGAQQSTDAKAKADTKQADDNDDDE